MKKPFKWILLFTALTGSLTLAACGENTKPEEKQATPKLLDLGAKKCIPCKMMAPILDELTKEYKGVFDVEFIDVWMPENQKKAEAYGIRTIPTQLFFDANGKELWRHEGFISKEDILKKWKELGFTFKAVEQETAAPASTTAESE